MSTFYGPVQCGRAFCCILAQLSPTSGLNTWCRPVEARPLTMSARMVPASREGQLAQLGVGDCLRFAVGDEHPDEGHAVGAKFQVHGAPFRQNCRCVIRVSFVRA